MRRCISNVGEGLALKNKNMTHRPKCSPNPQPNHFHTVLCTTISISSVSANSATCDANVFYKNAEARWWFIHLMRPSYNTRPTGVELLVRLALTVTDNVPADCRPQSEILQLVELWFPCVYPTVSGHSIWLFHQLGKSRISNCSQRVNELSACRVSNHWLNH